MKDGYLVVDVGTGNMRVAITETNGGIVCIERDNMHYAKDELYPDALSFDPGVAWNQIIHLVQKVSNRAKDVNVVAVTASSQREGIVLVDKNGEPLIGLPNHDHRGREWQDAVQDKEQIYKLTGRYPSSLFSALKLVGLRSKRPEIFEKVVLMMSISDWVQFQFCKIAVYEHSQASETLLYDVESKKWSDYLCGLFQIDPKILPEVKASGSILGPILPNLASTLQLDKNVKVIVGGADTQLAIKSTAADVDDIILVSGTTTPVTKVVTNYITDSKHRTWTNRYVDDQYFILETNAGVTGLNFQRLKNIFYPNEGYEIIEQEINSSANNTVASLGSLIAGEEYVIKKAGFSFDIPVSDDLSRGNFMKAALWDAACCIYENYKILTEVSSSGKEFVWACGGGFQSVSLRKFVSGLIGKPLYIREGFQQASVVGGAMICAEVLNRNLPNSQRPAIVDPEFNEYDQAYREWKKVREEYINKERRVTT